MIKENVQIITTQNVLPELRALTGGRARVTWRFVPTRPSYLLTVGLLKK